MELSVCGNVIKKNAGEERDFLKKVFPVGTYKRIRVVDREHYF